MEESETAPLVDGGNSPSLKELKSEEASLIALLKVLLNPRTLPHVILLGLLSTVFFYYARSGQEAFSALGYVSLAGGYLLTGLLSRFPRVRQWTQLSDDIEKEGPVIKRLLLSFRICLFPLLMSGIAWFVLDALIGEDRLFGAGQDLLPVTLGFGFVLWAVIQGRSVGRWVASASASKLPETGERSAGTRTSTVVMFSLLLIVASGLMLMFDSLLGLTDGTGMVGVEQLAFLGAFIAVFAFAWKRTDNERHRASEISDVHAFTNRWMLLSQGLITWHMLTIWRHAVGEHAALMMVEELALMAFTVVMAIWGLTSRSFKSSFKLVDENNALPVGLSFGYAYAGSVAMVTAVLETDVKVVMIIGHAIVVLTLLWLQPKVLRGVLANHQQVSNIQNIVESIELPSPNVAQEESSAAKDPVVEASEPKVIETIDDIGGDTTWSPPGVLAETVEWGDDVELVD